MEKKPHTIEDVLEAIQQTLDTLQNRKTPFTITPELLADVEKLKAAVQIFKEDTDQLFELLDIDIKGLQKEVVESPKLKSYDRQLFKQAKDIEKKACAIKFALVKAGGRRSRKSSKSSESKRQGKQRHKLFKSIGGDKKWIPM